MNYQIVWKGNQHTNTSSRNGHIPFVIVNHISAGTMSSMDSWFTSPNNTVSSAHFGIAKDGRIHQYVEIEQMAWANGIPSDKFSSAKAQVVKDMKVNPNLYTISIEHEGMDGELTEAQFKASVWLHKYIKDYVKKKWNKDIVFDKYHVVGHFQINPIGKPNCPGPKFPWDRLYQELNQKGEIKLDVKNKLQKERVYVEYGVLKKCNGDYSKKATDVHWIKFDKNKIKLKMVWEKGAKLSDLVRKYNADYGFNFSFFWNGNPVADCKINNQILNQGYDEPNGAKQTKWHGFGYKNNQITIGQLNINDSFDFLTKTTPLLLNGQGVECWDWYRQVEGTANDIGRDKNGNLISAQRTFVGLDANGDLIVAVADGRTKYDKGLTLEEMAKFMKDKGAVWALNGDGGGSSIIADKTGGLNQNENNGVNERAVNHAILVYFNDSNNPPTDTPKEETDWRVTLGSECVDYLAQHGIVDSPDGWKAKMTQPAENWMVFKLLTELHKKLYK